MKNSKNGENSGPATRTPINICSEWKQRIDGYFAGHDWTASLKDRIRFGQYCLRCISPFTDDQRKAIWDYADEVFRENTGYTEEQESQIHTFEDARREYNDALRDERKR